MAHNTAQIEKFAAQAAGEGAQLLALPENAFYMRSEKEDPPPAYTQNAHPAVAASADMARRHGIWLLAGSIHLLPDSSGDGRLLNRSILFSPEGKIAASYDKIHLFDVDVGDGQTYRESSRFAPGSQAVVAQAGDVPLGLSVCYDLRFPQLYRALAKAGAKVIAVPSAFTQVTGEAHWHVLLRARAIENACYMIAPAQTGTHPGGRQTYGHSLIISPWGEILADAGSQEGIIYADLDMRQVDNVRRKLPSLTHDREFTLACAPIEDS